MAEDFDEEEITPAVTANENVSTEEPTIHLSGDDGQMVSQATQIVFHKMQDGKLFIEVFPNEKVSKYLGYFQFNLADIAQIKLREFLNTPVTY